MTGIEVRIVNDDDFEMPVGEMGEIVLRGDEPWRVQWLPQDAERHCGLTRRSRHARRATFESPWRHHFPKSRGSGIPSRRTLTNRRQRDRAEWRTASIDYRGGVGAGS
jgi:hypothetical protein